MSHLAPKKQGPNTAHYWETPWHLINRSLLYSVSYGLS